MAKTKQMEIVKGVSAQQHIEIHSILFSGAGNDRQLNIQFARWGSKESFEAGEKPLRLYPPVVLTGPALVAFRNQGNMVGAAWGFLDLIMADQVPAALADHVQVPDRGMKSELQGSTQDGPSFNLNLGAS